MSSIISTDTAFPMVAGVEVTTDDQGRFNLNALHKASGEGKHKKPSKWLDTQQAQDLVVALKSQSGSTPINVIRGGHSPGTFASKPLAVAYSMWLGGTTVFCAVLKSMEDASSIFKALQELEVPDDLPDMFVYAIQEMKTGNIKLGISRDPVQRLRQLQIGNSSKLKLVAYRKAENRFADERAIHADEASHRLRGEWFTADAMQALQ